MQYAEGQQASNKMSAGSDSVPAPENNFCSAAKDGMTMEECENMIRRSLRNPTVKFLREHLEKSGCKIEPSFIKAVNCKQQIAGRYFRGKGIEVCSNHLTIQDEVTQAVVHGLINAYVDCRDWTTCAHHACGEIRANHVSGECHYKRQLLRDYQIISQEQCVRRRAMEALARNPYCSKAAAKDAMEVVWDTCYNDTRPFDRTP